MQVILSPQRREAHTVKFSMPAEAVGEPDVSASLTFSPKVPTEVATEHLPFLRDDFRDGVLIVCRQDKSGRVEFGHKLTKQLAIANEAEVFAIAEGEAIKARLAEQLVTAPGPTMRNV